MSTSPYVRLTLAGSPVGIYTASALLLLAVGIADIILYHNNLPALITGIFLVTISVIPFIVLIRKPLYELTGDKLRVLSVSGNVQKEIPCSAVTGWAEIISANWFGGGPVLTIYTGYGNLQIVSKWYKNYYPLRAAICRDEARKAPGEQAIKNHTI